MTNNNTGIDRNTKVLEVQNLKKHFYHGSGKNKLTIPAVDGLTFDVYKREVFGLVGESGCGKTTTGRTIIKLLAATEGVVKLNDEIITAGYKEHIRDIKAIKEQANEEILKFDEIKYKKVLIERKLKQEVGFLKQDITNLQNSKAQRIKEAQKPQEDLKDAKYELKNKYDLDIDNLKYNYDLKSSNVKAKTKNTAKSEYNREVAGLKLGLERKTEGLNDSAALHKEEIEKRISELNERYDGLFKALEAKYEPLIAKAETEIIENSVAKSEVHALKQTLRNDIASRRAEYKSDLARLPRPDKAAIKVAVDKAKTELNNEIAKLKQKIADLNENAKAEISKLPASDSEYLKSADVVNDIEIIKQTRDANVEEKKRIIHELKTINKSPEALEYSRRMQMIFQDPISSLNPRMTVLEIVGEGLLIKGGHTKAEIKEKVQDMLEIVGLAREYASRYPHEFSGGQRQRIGVARALIMDPDFIIADEPISALDVSIRAQVINLLSDLKEKLGLTIMFIAHDLSVVRFFCDRIAVMYNGKIVEMAEAEELFNYPTHPYTKSLLSSVPQPDPDYERNRVRIAYDPRQHDYRIDKPTLREIRPDHFIYVNEKEFNEISENIEQSNSKTGEKK